MREIDISNSIKHLVDPTLDSSVIITEGQKDFLDHYSTLKEIVEENKDMKIGFVILNVDEYNILIDDYILPLKSNYVTIYIYLASHKVTDIMPRYISINITTTLEDAKKCILELFADTFLSTAKTEINDT